MEDGLPAAALTTVLRDGGAGPLATLLRATVLTVAGEPLHGRDLVGAGAVSGRWRRLEADLALGLALCDVSAPGRAEVDAALRAFRYARRLTSAQDMRRWLARRELELGELRAAIERELARDGRHGAGPAHAADRARALAALPAEAVLSGALRECGWWLADRLLAARRAPGGAPRTDVDEERLRAVAAGEARLLAVAALGEPAEERRARLRRILSADDAFAAQCAAALGEEAIARCLDAHRLAWVTFDLEGLRCAAPSVAAEAAMQLREDGIALHDVARAAGLEIARTRLLLEDGADAFRAVLAAAAAGEVVGPVEVEGRHEVWVVRRRAPPDMRDRVVAERAASTVLAADADRRRAGRVRWHDRD
jgi:hypothetical protein